LHHNVRDEWLLPKSHKDRGGDVTVAAVREMFEETSYPCPRLPLDPITQARRRRTRRCPFLGARSRSC
ncbi:hypothetical protein EDB84DRAFT_1267339, partial [Lactarius hengduanensis]